MPTDVSGHHPDDKFGESHFWEHYTFWDTFRCLMPLHNLVYPGAQRRIFHSLIRIGEAKNWLPDAWIAGDFAQAQGGCNAEIILSEAVQKGLLTGLDVNNAWKVCYANAMNKSSKPDLYGRQPEYLANGYCTAKVKNCTSASLEYAYNDFALSQMAIKIGKLSEGNILKERSEKVLNLWYPARKFFLLVPKNKLVSSSKMQPEVLECHL
jgi:putative alpha-1,2-mannosidase